nr:MAG TPA: hypothetical protein [Caudoviricetes sp.]DAV45758.1 MAG TPA: hypothetical protein [Caudoviricetes sp.]
MPILSVLGLCISLDAAQTNWRDLLAKSGHAW